MKLVSAIFGAGSVTDDRTIAVPPAYPPGIQNFAAVDESQRIYRGGQPSDLGLEFLSKLGVIRIIKLNPFLPQDQGETRFDLRYHPIGWFRQTLWRPSEALLHAAVAEIVPGTVIHCTHGQDRTGIMVGLWRLTQGWSKDAAYAEMLAHGFHPALQGLQGRWDSVMVEDWR